MTCHATAATATTVAATCCCCCIAVQPDQQQVHRLPLCYSLPTHDHDHMAPAAAPNERCPWGAHEEIPIAIKNIYNANPTADQSAPIDSWTAGLCWTDQQINRSVQLPQLPHGSKKSLISPPKTNAATIATTVATTTVATTHSWLLQWHALKKFTYCNFYKLYKSDLTILKSTNLIIIYSIYYDLPNVFKHFCNDLHKMSFDIWGWRELILKRQGRQNQTKSIIIEIAVAGNTITYDLRTWMYYLDSIEAKQLNIGWRQYEVLSYIYVLGFRYEWFLDLKRSKYKNLLPLKQLLKLLGLR